MKIDTNQDIKNELYNMCDREHSSCNSNCLVYRINDDKVPWNNDRSNCNCFKNGQAMFDFIKEKMK